MILSTNGIDDFAQREHFLCDNSTIEKLNPIKNVFVILESIEIITNARSFGEIRSQCGHFTGCD